MKAKSRSEGSWSDSQTSDRAGRRYAVEQAIANAKRSGAWREGPRRSEPEPVHRATDCEELAPN